MENWNHAEWPGQLAPKSTRLSEGAGAFDRPIGQRTGREDMGGPCTAAGSIIVNYQSKGYY